MDAPTASPNISINTTPTYYVARIDIEGEGSGYNKPPKIVITPIGPAPTEPAEAISRIRGGAVNEIDVTKYGKGYSQTPCVRVVSDDLDPAVGTGAEVSVTLDGADTGGDPRTGIVYWEVEQGETSLRLYCRDGITQVSDTQNRPGFTVSYYTGTGSGGTGTGATVKINAFGVIWRQGSEMVNEDPCATGSGIKRAQAPDVEVESFGSGYSPSDEVTLILERAPCGLTPPNPCKLVIKGYTLGHPKCPNESSLTSLNPWRSRKVTGISVTNPGSMYLRAPEVDAGSFGTLTATSNCSGEVTGVTDADKALIGTTVLFPPGLSVRGSTEAKATAIVRATLRGTYQCYYRYVNDTVPEEEGGPLYSSLSPVTEVDCGDGASELTWSYASPPSGFSVELWRTTSNQATTLFRVAKIGGGDSFGSTTDTLSDWELVDADRDGFQVMPILLPNGELNANRFGVPPSNFAVGVMFQDRMWMGVDTTGKEPNTLRLSEADEPESMPDVNEIILQSNLRSTDYLTALIPYAGAMICCQSRHSHRLTYVSQPLIDAAVFLLAYRGCINQRCWDIYEGVIYAMDSQGVYSMNAQGNVENLSLGLDNLWQGEIDMSLREWFMVRADRKLNVLRVNIALKGDGSQKYPTRQLVYSFDYKSWWEERYPTELTAGADCRTDDGELALVYGTSRGALRQLSSGLTDLADDSVSSVTITDRGRGYRKPPKITAPGGHGAEFEAGINPDGEITGIVIKHPGTGYSPGPLTIEPPESGGRQAVASFTVGSGSAPVHWSFRSGCFEYVTDAQDKKGGETQSRHCSVTYQPTTGDCELRLQGFYNNAKYPRSNVVRRDRGAGFVHSDEIPAAVLNMKSTPQQDAEAHGVARALFAGRVLDDMTGSDRHVSIALSGKQDGSGPVSIHQVDVYGVNSKGGE